MNVKEVKPRQKCHCGSGRYCRLHLRYGLRESQANEDRKRVYTTSEYKMVNSKIVKE